MLGLQWSERPDGTIDLRTDNYERRIRLHQGPSDDLAYAGWEVKDAGELDALAAKLQSQGHALERAVGG